MKSLIIAIKVISPLTTYISLGYLMKHRRMFDDHVLNSLNQIIFKIFMPSLIFINVFKVDFNVFFNWSCALYSSCGAFIIFIIMVLLIPYLEKDSLNRGVLVQSIIRSNFLVFGLPIATSLCGEKGLILVSSITLIIVPIYNILGIVSLEIFRYRKIHWHIIFKNIITNPLIISSLIGGIFLKLNLELPSMFEYILNEIASITTPLALIVLGGSLDITTARSSTRSLAIGLIGKLILAPVIFILIAILKGFRKAELVTIMIMFASPCAVSSYTMTKQIGGNSNLAGQLVVFGSIMSVFTIFCWVLFLEYFSFI